MVLTDMRVPRFDLAGVTVRFAFDAGSSVAESTENRLAVVPDRALPFTFSPSPRVMELRPTVDVSQSLGTAMVGAVSEVDEEKRPNGSGDSGIVGVDGLEAVLRKNACSSSSSFLRCMVSADSSSDEGGLNWIGAPVVTPLRAS